MPGWLVLPTRVHYALQGLCHLARHPGPVRARELAREEKIPAAQAAKLLYLLTWGGFVRSRRGLNGGFWLERPPESIRVREVIAFFHPPANRSAKSRDAVCRVWNDTVAVSRSAFEQLTIADLVSKNKSLPAVRRASRAAGQWAN
jgi:Rrf2 family transcriptional regulator, iron-sulfur cluster assembly transcription factor